MSARCGAMLLLLFNLVLYTCLLYSCYMCDLWKAHISPPPPSPLPFFFFYVGSIFQVDRFFFLPSSFTSDSFSSPPSAVDCVSLFIQFSIRNWNICVGIYASIYFPVSPLFTKVYSTFILNSPVQIFDTLHHLLMLVISDDDFRNGINTCNKMLCGGPTFFFWICFNLIVIDLKAPLTGLVCSTYNSVSFRFV